jgi:hypothetical protein
MAYTLQFLSKRLPIFVLTTEQSIRIQPREQGEVANYLGKNATWFNTTNLIGFGGCGAVKTKGGAVHVTFVLSLESIKHTLLSISFLLEELNGYQDRQKDFLTIENSCGRRHPVFGSVSAEFRQKLKYISKGDQQMITRSMQRVFVAVTPATLRQYASDCCVLIDAEKERFLLRCFGDACDMGIYPDSGATPGMHASFSCHNLDSPFQQATLLAGLVTLGEIVKRAG